MSSKFEHYFCPSCGQMSWLPIDAEVGVCASCARVLDEWARTHCVECGALKEANGSDLCENCSDVWRLMVGDFEDNALPSQAALFS